MRTRLALLAAAVGGVAMHTLSMSPTSLVGGKVATATLRLAQDAASGPTVYQIKVSDTSVASTPPTVSVGAASTIASFPVSTRPVAASRSVVVTVAGASATLTVLAPSLAKLGLSDSIISRGASIKGAVSLDGPAAAGGVAVQITATRAGLVFPASVTVPAAQSEASFLISADRTATPGQVTIMATRGRVTLQRTVTVP